MKKHAFTILTMVADKVTIERKILISFFFECDFSPYAKGLIADPVGSITSTGKKWDTHTHTQTHTQEEEEEEEEEESSDSKKERKSLRVKGRKSDALTLVCFWWDRWSFCDQEKPGILNWYSVSFLQHTWSTIVLQLGEDSHGTCHREA